MPKRITKKRGGRTQKGSRKRMNGEISKRKQNKEKFESDTDEEVIFQDKIQLTKALMETVMDHLKVKLLQINE